MRFKRLYKFYGAKSALRNLKQQQLKVSTLEDLNDPFEWNSFRIEKRIDRKIWEDIRRGFWANKGLISFSDRWSNPVLWSHYADKHRGLALGFDIPEKNCLRVVYEEDLKDLPSLEEVHASKDGSIFVRAATTKYHHWSYESEWRIVVGQKGLVEDSNLLFLPFSPELRLKEIVIGAVSEISSIELRKLTQHKIKITTARLAFGSFSVTPQLSKKRQK